MSAVLQYFIERANCPWLNKHTTHPRHSTQNEIRSDGFCSVSFLVLLIKNINCNYNVTHSHAPLSPSRNSQAIKTYPTFIIH